MRQSRVHKKRKARAASTHQIALVGRRIRHLRKERALTQAELSSRVGIQQSDLCRMESGEYKVSLEALFKILHVFEMNIAEFFHVATAGELTPEEQELVAAYRVLTRGCKLQVRDFIMFTDQRRRHPKRPAKHR
jgi:transcriptional regulator with XRE-family HTH domain